VTLPAQRWINVILDHHRAVEEVEPNKRHTMLVNSRDHRRFDRTRILRCLPFGTATMLMRYLIAFRCLCERSRFDRGAAAGARPSRRPDSRWGVIDSETPPQPDFGRLIGVR
jgi:hypothetical protein